MPAIQGYAAQGATKISGADQAQKAETANARSERVSSEASESAVAATAKELPAGVGGRVNVAA